MTKGGGGITIVHDGVADKLTGRPEHVQHIMIDASKLRIKVRANRGTGGDISFHDIADDFDRFAIL